MTVEADINSALKALVSNRFYPDEAPAGAALPYGVFQQVGGDAPVFLERALPSKKNGRFQVSWWSATRAEAASLALQGEAAMVAATAFDAKPLGAPVAVVDEETKYRGARQDFDVWSDR
jgi:hypothetical protein